MPLHGIIDTCDALVEELQGALHGALEESRESIESRLNDDIARLEEILLHFQNLVAER